jgi:hypothetical protein
MKVPRQRGRPRGRYHALADFKLLEYLVLVSMKYGVDSNDFFNSFVEAWKSQQSTCNNLLIECRKRTHDHAVFLITNNRKVVAQFPIPKHILEENSPLKEFAYVKAPRKTTVEGRNVRTLQIRDLKSGMNQINLEAKVLEIPKPIPVVTRFGEFAKVTNVSVKDKTGIIKLPLWNNQIDTVSVGDVIQVENARVVTFRGERQLRVGRGGQLSVIEKR